MKGKPLCAKKIGPEIGKNFSKIFEKKNKLSLRQYFASAIFSIRTKKGE